MTIFSSNGGIDGILDLSNVLVMLSYAKIAKISGKYTKINDIKKCGFLTQAWSISNI